jgi:glutathione S-transferase
LIAINSWFSIQNIDVGYFSIHTDFRGMHMYTLYWHPYSSSYAPMAVLEELGVEFDLYEVDYDGGETKTAEYHALHPLGLIPALKISDDQSMFESAAIIIFLCDQHSELNLAPLPKETKRPAFLQWMLFMADTLYPSYNRYYHPERYTANASGETGVKEQAMVLANSQWRVIETELETNGPWLLGDRFSACDIYLQMITTWHEGPKDLFATFPYVRRVSEGVLLRKASRRAFERHNFLSGLE